MEGANFRASCMVLQFIERVGGVKFSGLSVLTCAIFDYINEPFSYSYMREPCQPSSFTFNPLNLPRKNLFMEQSYSPEIHSTGYFLSTWLDTFCKSSINSICWTGYFLSSLHNMVNLFSNSLRWRVYNTTPARSNTRTNTSYWP
jgi:hypothetical protein